MNKGLLTLAFSLFIFSACGPLKGYPGQELPNSKTALVVPDGEVDLTIGGKTVRHIGVTLLPGGYDVKASYRYDGPRSDPTETTEDDPEGYKECVAALEAGEREEPCDRASFVWVVTTSTTPSYTISCSGKVNVKAGSLYDFVFVRTGEGGNAWLVERSNVGDVTAVPCEAPKVKSSKVEQFRDRT